MKSNDNPTPGTLAAVRELEGALEERHDARDSADATLDAARLEAQRLLSDARAEGTEAGHRRRAALLTDAEADATAIRHRGETEAAEIVGQHSVEREELIAEFTAIVLEQEA
jgi:vacuolar-type H+-ATPase subunit H